MAMDKAIIFKIVELVLACCCLGLHCYSKAGNEHSERLATGTFVGYVIILLGLAIGRQLQCAVDRRLDLYFTALGFVLFLASGAMFIDYYDGFPASDLKDKGLATGSFAIITAIVFLADGILHFRS